MSKRPVRVASISDIHTGHPNTPTHHILRNLRRAFPGNSQTGELDLILIGGDFFDRPLYFHDVNAVEIKLWIHEFLKTCKYYGIAVRVLEGTPSHDWRQNRWFEVANTTGEIGCDLKYVDTLSIEYIEHLDLQVLYVPDEWDPETDVVWSQVQQLLQEKQLSQVDLAVVHGAFEFQLPSHVKAPKHSSERYQSIVRHYVLGAHIHKPSSHGRVLVNGSFDRLTHGEEEPKGHWRLVLRENPADDEITFVVNHDAWIYRTLDCRGMELEQALHNIDQLTTLPDGSFIRIHGHRGDAVLTAMDQLRKRYPQYQWSAKSDDGADNTQPTLMIDQRASFTQVSITQDNIRGLLDARLQALTQDPALRERCRALLETYVS